jgi:hypothetical protein
MKRKFTVCISCLAIVLLINAMPATAQISQKSVDKHRKEQRRFLREADKADARYKETHLNVHSDTYKKGEVPRTKVRAGGIFRKFKNNEAGKPVKRRMLFRKKATK